MTNGSTEVVTMASMAAHLGVSTATIAKALHGQGRISPGMVDKIRTLAREWNYTPNLAARNLRTQRCDTVGLLITSDIATPWYSSLISHLEDKLSANNLTLTLALGKYDIQKSRQVIERVFSGRVCGIILGPILDAQHLQGVCGQNQPQVPLIIFGNPSHMNNNYVRLDQFGGAQLALSHLYQLGHRHIAYVGGEDPALSSRSYQTRSACFRQFTIEHDLPMDWVDLGNVTFQRRDAFISVNRLLDSTPFNQLPTAFFCHNDDIAIGVMLALQQRGYRIPEDFSITGFDDIEESSFTTPSITTVGGIMEQFTDKLVNSLLLSTQSPNSDFIQHNIVPQLIKRSSTSTPRGN